MHPRRPHRHRALALAVLATAALLPAAVAQTAPALDRIAPPDAVLALGFAADAGVPQGLADALATLDWEGAGATVARLLALLAEDGAALRADTDVAGVLRTELAAACPAADAALEGLDPHALLDEGLLAVVVAPFAPVPNVLALVRARDVAAAATVQDALVACFGGPSFDQDGVPLHVLGDGGDLPLVVARVGDVFVAGTDPNLVRGAIRRANGAAEPSLADGALGAARARLAPGGLDVAFDAGAVANVVEALGGSVPPDAEPLVARALAALRTLGAGAARVGWDADGLRLEQVLAVPQDAPDAALARLLTAAPRAGRPLWVPAGSVQVASNHVPVRAWVDYVDGWLADLEPLTGLRADLRGLAADHLDLDLDAALLGWVGETVHTVTLEPLGTDLRGWVYGPATVMLVPVADEAAARAGVRLLGPAALRAIAQLALLDSAMSDPFGADPFAPSPADAGLDALFGEGSVAIDTVVIAGVEADRLRMGPTTDVAIAVLDGHLVIASPPRALAALLATRSGGGDLLSGAAGAPWRAAYATVPDAARDVSVTDVGALLGGLADLAELAAQPLASAVQTALYLAPLRSSGGFGESWEEWDGSEDWGAYDPYADEWLLPGGRSAPAWDPDALRTSTLDDRGVLRLGETATFDLVAEAPRPVWTLEGVAPGTLVEVRVADPTSFAVDTYVFVVDADTGDVLFENDDFGSTDLSVVVFEALPEVRYRVVASSYFSDDEGTVTVEVLDRGALLAAEAEAEAAPVEPEPVAPEAVEPEAVEEAVPPPTFAELLRAADLLPQLLDLLAERTGVATSATTVEGGVVHTRTTIPLR